MSPKKDPKHIPPATPERDSERETRVLFEDVRSELKIVAEGHGLLVGRLDRVEGRLDKVEGRLDNIEGKLTQHDGRFDRIEGQLGQLQKQVVSVLTDHESRLKTLETK